MTLGARLARLASPPLRDARIRSLARALVPARFHDRARLTFEAAMQQDVDRDLARFRSILADRPAHGGITGRVALVCGSLGPGGTQRQIVNTLQGLTRAGAGDLHLLCDRLGPGTGSQDDFFLADATATGAPVRGIRPNLYKEFPFESLPASLRAHFSTLHPLLASMTANLYWELKDLRPAVVHAWLDWTNVSAGIAAALAGVPRIILSGRNGAPHRFARYAPFMDAAYRALSAAPGVSLINNSRAGADDYAAWLGLDPACIGVIYNGVDRAGAIADADARERSRAAWRIPPRADVVGGMFRFAPEKRPLLWLEAAAAVAAQRPDTEFVIFGDGELRTEMEAAAGRLGLTARLRMPGVTSAPFAALNAMDALLLTSEWEGTSNAALEAQACGVPVIVTRGGGSVEAIVHGETGWIVDAAEAPAIAARVAAALDDRGARQRIRAAGPRFIAGRFGVDRMVEDTLRAYGCAR